MNSCRHHHSPHFVQSGLVIKQLSLQSRIGAECDFPGLLASVDRKYPFQRICIILNTILEAYAVLLKATHYPAQRRAVLFFIKKFVKGLTHSIEHHCAHSIRLCRSTLRIK
ncbi:hypothetical protein BM449_00445 [Synechococcus sp. SynAce01]|nr:hypothetical protein BM449_00445 [Synechococcus sp. SynAce01]